MDYTHAQPLYPHRVPARQLQHLVKPIRSFYLSRLQRIGTLYLFFEYSFQLSAFVGASDEVHNQSSGASCSHNGANYFCSRPENHLSDHRYV